MITGKRRIMILLIIIGISIPSAILIYSRNTGHDKVTLIGNHLSKQYKAKTLIKIFDNQEIYDKEIVGFTIVEEEQKCAFAVMQNNGHSNYKLIKLIPFEKLITRASDIYIQYIDLFDEKNEIVPYLVVLSLNADLSKIEMTVKDGKTIDKEIDANPSLTLIKLPIEDFTGEYLFYDRMGNLIK
ncbi:hypothetical protein [Gorillibacterium massiliense]|uniref:hypothetical protein n=1 Tax=Gorillibacterium massiliense TaxID=1280390 RepID=UPI0004B22CDD|nr:hypothetical protein [Gorillibacterium massiliense]